MLGTFKTCTIRDIAKLKVDIKIVGTIKQVNGQGLTWVKQLAPSSELFNQSRQWKKQELWPNMWPEYERQFKELMAGSMKPYLDRLELRLSQGKHIAFACFCSDYNICHRSLISQYLEQQGHCWIRG